MSTLINNSQLQNLKGIIFMINTLEQQANGRYHRPADLNEIQEEIRILKRGLFEILLLPRFKLELDEGDRVVFYNDYAEGGR